MRNMTAEAKIELMVEKMMDSLDQRLMNDELTQEEYDREITILDKWASNQMKSHEPVHTKFRPDWED